MTVHKLQTWFLSILLVAVSVLLPACKDLQEVDDLNIVLALGIDETSDQQVRVTAEIVNAAAARGQGQAGGGGGAQAQPTFNREETGKTVEEAVDKFNENTARNLFLPHNTVVVFGRGYAEQGIDRAMDYLERNRYYRRNQLWVVTDGTASDLLKASGKPESYNAMAIRSLVEQGVQKSTSVNSTQLLVMRQYLRPSHSPTVAYLNTVNSRLCGCGIGLFDGGRFRDYLPAQEAEGLLLFVRDISQTELTLPCPGSSQADLGNTFRLLTTHTEVEPLVQGNNVTFRVKVRGRAEVERLCPESKLTPETLKRQESLLASEVQTRMEKVFARLQRDNVDAVEFGDVVFEKKPSSWRQLATRWKSVFPRVQVNYDVQIQLLRHGLASKSPGIDYSPQGLPPHAGRGGIAP